MTTDFQKIIRGLIKEISPDIHVHGYSPENKVSIIFRGKLQAFVTFENDIVVLSQDNSYINIVCWTGHLSDPTFCDDFKRNVLFLLTRKHNRSKL